MNSCIELPQINDNESDLQECDAQRPLLLQLLSQFALLCTYSRMPYHALLCIPRDRRRPYF